ncbi:MAG: ADP-glyceromanno-heptose 6-epimerase [Bacteroidetes bacterium]|nr:ADP-glyceromanno-heptose 6-epimerase [Bacteroidota bacterium]MCA6442769.1 ADP-glyceromanno-heptose 6-epimerase [Bacteroidota bacterium]
MIVVTGAAGFIASCLISKLNSNNITNLVLVDDFSFDIKQKNYANKKYIQAIERTEFLNWFEENAKNVSAVFHIGARTDTTEKNLDVLNALNLNYTKTIWEICSKHQIKLIYASSAATYGLGENGYKDDESILDLLKPLNLYGESKNNFDKWAVKQNDKPIHWYGLKFFNVYGPNEYHKGRMASVIFHAYNQIKTNGIVKLFRSHNPNYKDGGQLRDFVYVKDVVDVLFFLYSKNPNNGIYNLGSGKARSFYDLALATYIAMNQPPSIEFIDTPIDIREKYQYFTEADMSKLIHVGYKQPFTSLEEGVKDYVCNYLIPNKIL